MGKTIKPVLLREKTPAPAAGNHQKIKKEGCVSSSPKKTAKQKNAVVEERNLSSERKKVKQKGKEKGRKETIMKKLTLLVIAAVIILSWGTADATVTTISGTDSFFDVMLSVYGAAEGVTLDLREYWGGSRDYDYYAFLKIDLSDLPIDACIRSVRLSLFYLGTWGTPGSNVIVGYPTDEFTELLDWTTYDGWWPWTDGDAAGINCYGWAGVPNYLAHTYCQDSEAGVWKDFTSEDMADYIKAQRAADKPAYLWMGCDSGDANWQRFASSEYTDYEPILEIIWVPEPSMLMLLPLLLLAARKK